MGKLIMAGPVQAIARCLLFLKPRTSRPYEYFILNKPTVNGITLPATSVAPKSCAAF